MANKYLLLLPITLDELFIPKEELLEELSARMLTPLWVDPETFYIVGDTYESVRALEQIDNIFIGVIVECTSFMI